MWEVHYSHEAAIYLEDNGQLIAKLFFAMESLAATSGLPAEEEFQEFDGLIYWFVLNHMVVYRKIGTERTVRILSIKPD